MYRPAKLYISNDKLVVFDDVKNDLFKVFKLPTLDYCYSFSNKGGGPDEFHLVDKESVNVDDGLEILYRNILHRYQITDSTFLKMESENNSMDLILTSVNPINNFKRLGKYLYVYNNNIYKNNDEFCLLNLKTKQETMFGEINEDIEEMNVESLNLHFSKAICVNDSLQRFAAFYYHRPVFKIYSSDMKLVKAVRLVLPERNIERETIFFTEPYATKEHIYVMWICKTKESIERDMEAFRPEIMIFDWEGNLLKRLKVNKPIITFAVSEQYKELYAVSFLDTDINKIYKFPLPHITVKGDNVGSAEISNNFYSIQPIGNYRFAQKEIINKTVEMDGYIVNVVNLAADFDKMKQYEQLGGMALYYYAAFKENANLDRKLEELVDVGSVVLIDTLSLNQSSVVRIVRSKPLESYDGSINQREWCDYILKGSNSIVMLSIHMEEGNNASVQLEEPLSQDIEKMLASLKFK